MIKAIYHILSEVSVVHAISWILSTVIGAVIGVYTNIWLKRNSAKAMGKIAAGVLFRAMLSGFHDSRSCLYVAIKKHNAIVDYDADNDQLVKAMKLQANIPENDKVLKNMKWLGDVAIGLGKDIDRFDNVLNNVHLFARQIQEVRDITLSHQKNSKEGILGKNGNDQAGKLDMYLAFLKTNLPDNIEQIIMCMLAMMEIMDEFNGKIKFYFDKKNKIDTYTIGLVNNQVHVNYSKEVSDTIVNYIMNTSYDGYRPEDIVSKLIHN